MKCKGLKAWGYAVSEIKYKRKVGLEQDRRKLAEVKPIIDRDLNGV